MRVGKDEPFPADVYRGVKAVKQDRLHQPKMEGELHPVRSMRVEREPMRDQPIGGSWAVVFWLGKGVGQASPTQSEGERECERREAMAVSVHAAKVAARLPTVVSRRASRLSLHAETNDWLQSWSWQSLPSVIEVSTPPAAVIERL